MMTWAMFLGDDSDVDELWSVARLTAVGTSAVLHAILVVAVLGELPQTPAQASQSTIDVTFELTSPVDGALLDKSDGELATPEPASTSRLLIAEPAPNDSPAPDVQSAAPESPPELAMAARESASEVPRAAELETEDAAVALVSPPVEPKLEEVLPPIEPTPPTVDAHDFASARPAPTPGSPAQAHRAPAPASPPSVPSPPVRRPALAPKPEEPRSTAGRSASISLGSDQAQRKAEEDYFWQLVRKISQFRYYAKSRENTEQGVVVTRMTVARDGRLLDVSLLKSSGFPNLDNGVVEAIRRASPFAPLPADMARDQQTFVVPISYRHER